MDEKIKLKSKVMIEYFDGHDEISKDELNGNCDFSGLERYEGYLEEKKLLEEDILSLIMLAGEDLEIVSLPNGLETLNSEILKETYTHYFDGFEEIFEKMQNTPVELSQNNTGIFCNVLVNENEEISEYDMFKWVKIYLENDIEMSELTVYEFEMFDKYIPHDIKVGVIVKNEEELKKVSNIPENVELIMTIEMLKQMEEIDSNPKINLSIDNMSELTVEELLELKLKYNISKINIQSEKRRIGDNFNGTMEKSEYDVDTYIKLRMAIDEIIKGIELDAPEIEKFTKIYERLAYKIEYDYEELKYNNSDGAEGRRNKNAHNLIGALLENLSVCEGISRVLEQVSYCLGLEAPKVHGEPVDKEQKNGHAWNRVKIDGIFYNTDLTFDLENIKNGSTPNYCLQSTEEFQHQEEYRVIGDEQVIDVSYDQDKVCKYFSGRRFEIGEGNLQYSSSELIDLIKNLLKDDSYISDGVCALINHNGFDGSIMVQIANILYGKKIFSDVEFELQEEDAIRFMEDLIVQEGLTRKNGEDSTSLIREETSEERMVVYEFNDLTKQRLKERNIDIDNVGELYEQEPEKSEEINDEILQDSKTQEQTAIVEYKESFIKKIVNSIKNIYKKTRERLFSKVDNPQESGTQQNTVATESKKEKLASWDLRNWSQEELLKPKMVGREQTSTKLRTDKER